MPEPQVTDFVVMTPTLLDPIDAFSVDAYADCAFTSSVSGNVLTVTSVQFGTIIPGAALFGSGLSAGVYINGTVSGTGGVGTYSLNQSLGTIGSQTMAAGVRYVELSNKVLVQLDFHGDLTSGDNAQTVAALWRDSYAVEYFKNNGPAAPPGYAVIPPGSLTPQPFIALSPLYADGPHQTPFVNAESQYEWRWRLDAYLQANQIVTVPQQFAAEVNITLHQVQ